MSAGAASGAVSSTPGATPAKRGTRRFRQQDWLALGLAELTRQGAAGLTIEHLCAMADRTRGSFYHHFADHDAFIRALMGHWRAVHTDAVITAVEAAPPDDRPQSLHTLASHLDHRLDIAVRRLAATHPIAADMVRRVDEARIAFVAALYRAQGRDRPERAETFARLEYALFVGSQVLWPDAEPASLLEIKALFADLVRTADRERLSTGPEASAGDSPRGRTALRPGSGGPWPRR